MSCGDKYHGKFAKKAGIAKGRFRDWEDVDGDDEPAPDGEGRAGKDELSQEEEKRQE